MSARSRAFQRSSDNFIGPNLRRSPGPGVSKKFTLSTFVPLPHLTTRLKDGYIRRIIPSGGTAYRRYNNGTTNEGHFRSNKFSCGGRRLKSRSGEGEPGWAFAVRCCVPGSSGQGARLSRD